MGRAPYKFAKEGVGALLSVSAFITKECPCHAYMPSKQSRVGIHLSKLWSYTGNWGKSSGWVLFREWALFRETVVVSYTNWDKELAYSCMTKGSQTVMNGRPFSLPKREKDPKRYMSPHTLGWLLDHPPVGLSLQPAHCVLHVPNMFIGNESISIRRKDKILSCTINFC